MRKNLNKDMAVYCHNTGVWYIIPSSTDTFYGVGWIEVSYPFRESSSFLTRWGFSCLFLKTSSVWFCFEF
jgi:hypothetical protein